MGLKRPVFCFIQRFQLFNSRQSILVILLFLFTPLRYSSGATNQQLIQHYNNRQYLTLLNTLKFDYHRKYTQIQLYLLSKALLHTNEFSKAETALQLLEKRVGPLFKDVILLEKMRLLIQKGEKDKFLIFLMQSPKDLTNLYLKEEIKQTLHENYANYKNRQLIKECLETLFPILVSFQNEPEILTLYLNSLSSSHPTRKIILASIWEQTDITRSSPIIKGFASRVKKNVSIYQKTISSHFKNQSQFKNWSYIIREIPTYLALLKDENRETVHQLRSYYFKAMGKKRQFTKLINTLETKKGRRFLRISQLEALSKQFELLLKKNDFKKAIQLTNRMKKLNPDLDLHSYILAIATHYYQKGKYKSSLEYFTRINTELFSKENLSKYQWTLFRIYQKLNNQKALKKIIQWSSDHEFESSEIAARFCYWGHKLELYPKGDVKSCYNKYPLTYYGLRSEKPTSSPSIQNLKSYDRSLPGFNENVVSETDKRFFLFLSTLYSVGEGKIADSIVAEVFKIRNDISFFIEIANTLLQSKRYYLLQTLVQSYYSKLPQNRKDREFFLPYFYPNAYYQTVKEFSQETFVPELLVFSVIREESHFRPEVESIAGAVGLMQLMPKTAKYIGKTIGLKVKISDLVEPDLNIKLGTAYLKRLLKRYKGNVYYTLAAYNGGSTNVRRWRKKAASEDTDHFVETITFVETQNYVRRVMRSFYIYQKIYGQNP